MQILKIHISFELFKFFDYTPPIGHKKTELLTNYQNSSVFFFNWLPSSNTLHKFSVSQTVNQTPTLSRNILICNKLRQQDYILLHIYFTFYTQRLMQFFFQVYIILFFGIDNP